MPLLQELYILRYMLRALYLRCIAFNCFMGVFTRFNCLSFIIGGFWRVLVPVLHSCRVAFPLGMLSRSIFSLVLRFLPLGHILGRVRSLKANTGKI